MRNIISLAHISLDGFLAGPDGDMDFIVFDDELADHIYPLIDTVDTAVYGRVTYQMMEGYWPTAGDASDAGAHTKSHARWYNGVKKIVASRTLPASKDPKVQVVGEDIVGALRAEKQKAGGDIMIFGSPSLTRTLAAAELVDEWRITVQPVILGDGRSLFPKREQRAQLELRSSKTFRTGIIAAHYGTKRSAERRSTLSADGAV
ncbi:MAG TPA: dihydrofolate reductase family protein [Kofleriaceae bacterium]|jgi:dihydrofolate reductase|nr:dihydrofolate reductase family protein [Kofleriaceae bacterium]